MNYDPLPARRFALAPMSSWGIGQAANLPGVDGQFAALAVLALLGTIVGVAILVISTRRRMVTENSGALAALRSLNRNYREQLKYPGPIVYNWEDRVNSKAKLDRYDLNKFFLARLAVLEDQILSQIAVRMKDVSVYAEYRTTYEQLGPSSSVAQSTKKSTTWPSCGSSRSSSQSKCSARPYALLKYGASFGTSARRDRIPTPGDSSGTSMDCGAGSLR